MTTTERQQKIRELLDIDFADSNNYTAEELANMSDTELQDCHKEECNETDLELCVVCQEYKVCDYEDEEGRGSICETCANEADEDTESEGEEGDEEEEEFEEEGD